MTDTTEERSVSRRPRTAGTGALSSMRLAELQALAGDLGVKGTSRMRKSDLVDTIREKTGGATKRPSRAASAAEQPTSNDKPARAEAPVAAAEVATSSVRADASADAEKAARLAQLADAVAARAGAGAAGAARAAARAPPEGTGEKAGEDKGRNARSGNGRQNARQQRPRERGRRRSGPRTGTPARQHHPQPPSGPAATAPDDRAADRNNDRANELDDDGRNSRRRRGRDRGRDRKRGRGRRDRTSRVSTTPVEVRDDDVLLPVAGILDILDNYAFVRTSGYLPGNERRLRLAGPGQEGRPAQRRRRHRRRPPAARRRGRRRAAPGTPSNKFNALVRLDSVNGMTPDEARDRPDFAKLTPLYPQERLRLETEATKLTPRVIDLVAPIGKGQRGLIVAPPKAGKTLMLQADRQRDHDATTPRSTSWSCSSTSARKRSPTCERTVKGEVIASTFDRPADDHTTGRRARDRAGQAPRGAGPGRRRAARLASPACGRAYNLAAPASGRILSGGVDSAALYPPKRFFGAARNIENGGSLTILATALVETGLEDGRGDLRGVQGHREHGAAALAARLAEKRIFPAIDVDASGTRREEILMSTDELKIVWKLRRVMGALDQQQAIELLLGQLTKTKTNVEFLLQVQKTTPGGPTEDDERGRDRLTDVRPTPDRRRTHVDTSAPSPARASRGTLFGWLLVHVSCGSAGRPGGITPRRNSEGGHPPDVRATPRSPAPAATRSPRAAPQTSGKIQRRRLQRLPPVLHGQAEDPRHRWPRGPLRGALRQEAAADK